jgi:hypothetical protein
LIGVQCEGELHLNAQRAVGFDRSWRQLLLSIALAPDGTPDSWAASWRRAVIGSQ